MEAVRCCHRIVYTPGAGVCVRQPLDIEIIRSPLTAFCCDRALKLVQYSDERDHAFAGLISILVLRPQVERSSS